MVQLHCFLPFATLSQFEKNFFCERKTQELLIDLMFRRHTSLTEKVAASSFEPFLVIQNKCQMTVFTTNRKRNIRLLYQNVCLKLERIKLSNSQVFSFGRFVCQLNVVLDQTSLNLALICVISINW